MKALAVALIGGVVVYEFMLKKPSVPTRSTSAARVQAQSPQTSAAAVTSALSSAEKLIASILGKSSSSSSGARPSSGGGSGMSFGGGGGSSPTSRPSQSGFSQPSNQEMNTVTSPGGGTVTYNTDGTITIDGFVYDQNGNLVEMGPFLPDQIQQSAPGDGTFENIFDQQFLNDFTGGTPQGNQDAALAADANQQSFVPDDWETDPGFWG